MELTRKTLLVTLEFPPQIGGVSSYYWQLCQRFSADKIFVLTEKIPHRSIVPDVNFKIVRTNMLVRCCYPHWLSLIWKIFKMARREKIEQLWLGQVLPVGTAGLIAAKILHLPYITSTHGLDIMLPQTNWHKKILLKIILNQASIITANSQYTRKKLLKLGVPDKKIEVIYPEAKIKDKADQQTVELIINKHQLTGKKIILTVARLVERKGHNLVLHALAELKNIDQVVYIIVGNGPYQEQLVSLTEKLGLQKKVIFTGFVSEDELAAFYQLCNVFVLTPQETPTDAEGFGIVYKEVQNFSKPIIARDTGGVGEALKNYQNKQFVNDVISLTQALNKFL